MIAILAIAIIGFILSSIPKSSLSKKSAKNIEVRQPKKENIDFKKEATLDIQRVNGDLVTSLDIELAETDAERQQGLMYRTQMDGNQGMLFIFDEERQQSFWMKNTYIPLDIIFINKDWRIVDQYLGAEPKNNQSIRSRRPCKYVLEVNAGFCRSYNTAPGMRIVLNN